MRTLVVGGLAGAAWLLTASAAQAAAAEPGVDHGAEPVLAPLTGVLETAKPVLSTTTGLLGAALTPVTAQPLVEQPVSTGRATVRRAISDPATAVVAPSTTVDRSISIAGAPPADQPTRIAARTADRAGVDTSDRSADRPATRVSGLAGTSGPVAPLGVTRALAVPGALLTPVTQVALPVLTPVTALLRPMTSMLRLFAAPLVRTVGAVTRTVIGALPGPRGRPASAVTPVDDLGVYGLVPAGTTGTTVPGAAVVAAPRAAHTETNTSRLHAGRPERAVPTASSRNTGEAPRLPDPAPSRGEGSASGIPATASGSPVGGGAFATVPSSVMGSMVAYQLLPRPADTAVPRHDAEEPTVSPD
ncbi:hypothetical protein O7635_10145 [Asanoa sp. WMMD1127]|uniref:hypothetical protein n=1 Tax=Asanoa sp. WMMD1127 TaxID=3016107 RepID=UPI002417FF57|nr:hypothetical protein [Asanoa sp. WMMD1127]MDG4822213.1 hypothetical protein [Asanoa sp. WMMD1127]